MKKMLSILIAALLLLGCFGQSKEAAASMCRSEGEEPYRRVIIERERKPKTDRKAAPAAETTEEE